MQLRAAKYIDTKRGKEGGYFLARPAKEISLGQVIRLLDGPLAPIHCVSQTAYERCTCPDEDHCGLRMLMLDVRNAIARILDRYVSPISSRLRCARCAGMECPFPSWSRRSCPRPRIQTPGSPSRKITPRAASWRNSSRGKAARGRTACGSGVLPGPGSSRQVPSGGGRPGVAGKFRRCRSGRARRASSEKKNKTLAGYRRRSKSIDLVNIKLHGLQSNPPNPASRRSNGQHRPGARMAGGRL